MDDVFVYTVKLPTGVHEIVKPCLDGYTVYIDESLDDAHKLAAYRHALCHIMHNDFEKYDIQQIESDAHERRE